MAISTLRALQQIPGLRPLVRIAYSQYFPRATGRRRLFAGIYKTFDEAANAAPKNKRVGYDDSAYNYDSNHHIVLTDDYPVIFWLSRILPESSSLLDFGGSVGIAFYSYKKYITYPGDLRWVVYELPEVAQVGMKVREREGSPAALSFASKLSDVQPCEIFLAAGSLQFVPETLPQILANFATKPRHLVLNKMPVYDGDPFVTLQNTGSAFSPYRVVNKNQFVQEISDLGYELVDTWQNPNFDLLLPESRRHTLDAFTGLYFRQRP
jgi:putative methyltransferase (TIGR04325 family)